MKRYRVCCMKLFIIYKKQAYQKNKHACKDNFSYAFQRLFKKMCIRDRSGGWYPGDQDKGDIARIIFFMITRYSQLNVNTMGSLSMFKPVSYTHL